MIGKKKYPEDGYDKGKKKEETKPDPDADYTDEDDSEDDEILDAYDDSDYSAEDDEPVQTDMTGVCLEQSSGCFT